MTMLSDNQRLILETRFAGERKNAGIAYLLLFFTVIGHNFYLGRIGRGVAQLLLCFVLVGFIWVFFDIFTLHGTVQKMNEEMRQRMTMELLSAY